MNKWQNYKFYLKIDQIRGPQWWLDIYIIDTIVRTCLVEHKTTIDFWRFHRRIKNDADGHVLSFICYTNEKTSKKIDDAIISSQTHKILHDSGVLKEYKWLEKRIKNQKCNIEDLSEDNWPVIIQKSWPHFIMGSCETILDMIQQIKREVTEPILVMAELEQFYLKINEVLLSLWKYSGNHPFLHHLNALFGYEPLLIQPKYFAQF